MTEDNEHKYPHHSGEVTPELVLDDMQAHPDAYPQALRPVIRRVVGGMIESTAAERQGVELSDEEKIIALVDQGDLAGASEYLGQCHDLPASVAWRLLNEDCESYVVQNLAHFSGLDEGIATRLVGEGWAYNVLKHNESFLSLPTELIVGDLAFEGNVITLMSYRENVLHVSQRDVVTKLLSAGYEAAIRHHLDLFECDNDLLQQLLSDGSVYVLESIDQFHGVDINEAVLSILEHDNWGLRTVLQRCSNIHGLGQKVALRLVDLGQSPILNHFSSAFEGLDWDALSNYAFEKGQLRELRHLIVNANDLSNDIANALIGAGGARDVLRNVTAFPDLNQRELTDKMIDQGDAFTVVQCVRSPIEFDGAKLSKVLMQTGPGRNALASSLEMFHDLDKSIAYRLIDDAYAPNVWAAFDHFTDLDCNDLATCTIVVGDAKMLLDAVGKLRERGVDIALSAEIAEQLYDEDQGWELLRLTAFEPGDIYKIIETGIQRGMISAVINSINIMPANVDRDRVYRMLMDSRQYDKIASYIYVLPESYIDELKQGLLDNSGYRGLLQNIEYFPSVDPNAIRDKLIDAKEYGVLTDYLDLFDTIDGSVLPECVKWGLYDVVVNIDKFTNVDRKFVVDYACAHSKQEVLLANIDAFPGIDIYKLVDLAFVSGDTYLIANNLDKLQGLSLKFAKTLLEEGYVEEVLSHIGSFEALPMQDVLQWACNGGGYEVALMHLDIFAGVNMRLLVERAIAIGDISRVVESLDKISGISQDDIIRIGEGAGEFESILKVIDRFTNIDRMHYITKSFVVSGITTTAALAQGTGWMAIDFDDPRSEIFSTYLANNSITSMDPDTYTNLVKIMSRAKATQVPEGIREQRHLFGKYLSVHTALATEQMHKGDTAPDAVALGVTETGEAGIKELQQKITELAERCKRDGLTNDDRTALLTSKIARSILMAVAEYDPDTVWGKRTDDALKEKLEYFDATDNAGLIEPMHEEYTTSRVYEVERLGDDKQEAQWSTDVLERYGVLLGDIRYAERALTEPRGMSKLMEELRIKIDTASMKLSGMIDHIDPQEPKADVKRRNLEKRYATLRKYLEEVDAGVSQRRRFVMNSPEDFQNGFAQLEPYGELHSAMRRLTFAWALHKHPEQRQIVDKLNADPTIDDLGRVREFADVIVNEDTYGNYFSNKRLASKFRQMTSAKALSEAMLREQTRQTGASTTELQFMPTRSIYLELSGHIGGACWADKHDSIAEDKPQMTGVIMKSRPGTDSERMAGAALLIETKDINTGEGVLLLRGLNPKQNYINKLNVGSFYEATADYVRTVAAKRGLKPAIVIDDHCTGSATNRPALFEFLDERRKSMVRVDVDNDSTNFNEYNVVRESYAL